MAAAVFILLVRFYARLREVLGLILWVIHSIPFIPYPLLFILSKGKGTRKGDLTEGCCRPPSSPRSQVAFLVHEGTRDPSAASPQSCLFPWVSKQALTLSPPGPFRRLHPALSPPDADADIFFFGGAGSRLTDREELHFVFQKFSVLLKASQPVLDVKPGFGGMNGVSTSWIVSYPLILREHEHTHNRCLAYSFALSTDIGHWLLGGHRAGVQSPAARSLYPKKRLLPSPCTPTGSPKLSAHCLQIWAGGVNLSWSLWSGVPILSLRDGSLSICGLRSPQC